jgi:putative redox protein
MNDVTVRLIGRRRMVGTNDLGHSIVMDTPIEYGGDDSGMRPLELVLYGLAGCTGMDVVAILEKQRQKVTRFSVRVIGIQTEDKPSRYERIDVTYEVVGLGVNPDFVARAIELSEEKYCSVRACLAPDIMLTSTYHVLEDPALIE